MWIAAISPAICSPWPADCAELAEEKFLDPQIFAGLRDTLGLVQGLTGENALLSQLDAELAKTPSDLRAAATLLQRAVEQSAKISNALANRDGGFEGLGANATTQIATSIWTN